MIYVSSDWHGCSVAVIESLLNQAGFGENDFLFVLGDVIDRGEHGIDLLSYIMERPNIELIRGNHEQMLLSCSFLFEEITEASIDALPFDCMQSLHVWKMNGARPTLDALSRLTPDDRMAILDFLTDTPMYDTVTVEGRDFLLVHGGLCLDEEGRIMRLEDCNPEALLWMRPQLTTEYSHDFLTLIGHTPTNFYGEAYRGKILKTPTWIDLDTGAARGLTPALLRLDDMAEFYVTEGRA